MTYKTGLLHKALVTDFEKDFRKAREIDRQNKKRPRTRKEDTAETIKIIKNLLFENISFNGEKHAISNPDKLLEGLIELFGEKDQP